MRSFLTRKHTITIRSSDAVFLILSLGIALVWFGSGSL
jgi:hypothetical protein